MEAVNCHHYVQKEVHFWREVLLTRKGAVSARAGELGIIPGAMDAQSYIVRGKGNAESFHSGSHGADHEPARSEAARPRRRSGDHNARRGMPQGSGRDRRDTDGLQGDRQSDGGAARPVEAMHTLRQVVCVKG